MTSESTIFIVDDDDGIRRAITVALQVEGYEVRSFASAKSFLDIHDSVGRGCLILDMSMPGMNGLELQDRLVEMKSPLPIIFMTGDGQTPEAERALNAGALAFLRKPFDFDTLTKMIDEALALNSATAPANAALDKASLPVGRSES